MLFKIVNILLLALALSASTAFAYERIDQGWNDDIRSRIYQIDEGSQMVPLNWLLNLEEAGSSSGLLRSSTKYGLVFDKKFTAEAGKLPIGFSVRAMDNPDPIRGKSWAGINCTACHTGLLQIGSNQVLIEGGRSQFDFQAFQDALVDSVKATVNKPAKLARFADRLGLQEKDRPALAQALSDFATDRTAQINRDFRHIHNGQNIPYGPGRVDGVGAPTNDTTCVTSKRGSEKWRAILDNPANCSNSGSPGEFPHLWGITYEEFVQWAGFVHSSIGRNVGQALGVFSQNWYEDGGDKPLFKSSINLNGMIEAETIYSQLRSPKWDDLAKKGIVPPIDQAAAKRGSVLYQNNCASCHAVQPEFTAFNQYGYSFWKVKNIDPAVVGTDPTMIQEQMGRFEVAPDYLVPIFESTFGASSIQPGNIINSSDYHAYAVTNFITQLFTDSNLTPIQQLQASNCRENPSPDSMGYKARSLEGIVFAAPHLHNGSVPSIADLLKPASERPKQFRVGCHRFNPETLGYDCENETEGTAVYDTTLSGNGNGGHEYGTELDSSEKRDLVEYLKSLTDPALPPVLPNSPCGPTGYQALNVSF